MRRFFTLSILACLLVSLGSCSKDSAGDEPKNPVDNQSPDKFHPSEWVGVWGQNVSEKHPAMLLAPDGRAILHTVKQDGKYNTPYDFTWYDHYNLTEWTYDPETKYLSVGSWIFEITMKTPKSWSGIYRVGSKSYDQYLQRSDDEELEQYYWSKAGGKK